LRPKYPDIWDANENELRSIIADAQQHAERGNAGGLRQSVSRFFDTLRSKEAKQEAINGMKAEIEQLRLQAEQVEEKVATARAPKVTAPPVPVADTWRAELAKNREQVSRLGEEVADLERQVEESDSVLDQSMIRGTLADRRRKFNELERLNRALEQRIEQTEEAPLIPSA